MKAVYTIDFTTSHGDTVHMTFSGYDGFDRASDTMDDLYGDDKIVNAVLTDGNGFLMEAKLGIYEAG